MKYSSQLGCLFYYDRVLYSWQVCEPTTLFLLGFESITSFNSSSSDSITITKKAYDSDNNILVPLAGFNTFDKIYTYLSQFETVEDSSNYAKYYCNGVKLLLNSLTGINLSRTIPIIFHNDVNNNFINLNSSMSRLSRSYTKMSIFDLQSQKILDLFSDAGFEGTFESTKYSLGYIDDEGLIPIADKDAVLENNSRVSLLYEEKISNSNMYKLFDYRAMYQYALGVLYGCRCLGYSPYFIWRFHPSFWYTGDYTNLVNTAWEAFRFYYLHHIPELEEDSDKKEKYQSISDNEIWNFSDEANVHLKYDEEIVYKLTNKQTIDENTTISVEPIVYSKSTIPVGIHIHTGSYLYDLSYDNVDSYWHSVDELISDVEPKSGIVTNNVIIRYLGNTAVRIFKAYSCSNNEYLSPNETDKYFITTDMIGWVPFNEDLWRHFGNYSANNSPGSGAGSGSEFFPTLTLSPRKFSDLPSGSGVNLFKGKAITNQEPRTTVGFYRCYLIYEPTPIFLYGICDESYIGAGTDFALPDDFAFIKIMREDEFDDKYSIVYDLQMYDSSLEATIPIIDESAISIIILNGEEISYSDFYSHSNYGIIREELQLFNQNVGSSASLITCYHDNNSQYDRYCIPGVTSEWVSRQDVTDLGYIFVDGVTEIYNGNTPVEVIVDNHPED